MRVPIKIDMNFLVGVDNFMHILRTDFRLHPGRCARDQTL